MEHTPDIDSISGGMYLPCHHVYEYVWLEIGGAIAPLFLGCALSKWWNRLALSWGFKKCIIYGYGTCIGYIRDYKKFTVGGGWSLWF